MNLNNNLMKPAIHPAIIPGSQPEFHHLEIYSGKT